MRTKTDALRSLQKYVSQVLAPNPDLSSVQFAGTVWTFQGRVKGGLNCSYDAWLWLKSLDRFPPEPFGSPDVPASYYLQSDLVEDPAAAATAAGVTLPDPAGPTVGEFALNGQPAWEVRLSYDRGEIPEDKPHARVHFVGAGGTSGGPALYYDLTQPFGIECYPVVADTVKESTLLATAVEDVLLAGFRGSGVQAGRPRRIPMWDFDGVGIDETSEARGGSDYMKLVDFSSRQLPDPADPRRVAVMVDLRLSWRTDVSLSVLQSRVPAPVKGTRIVSDVRWEIDGS